MKKNVLFLHEKWCDAKPELAPSSLWHTLVFPFEQGQNNYNFNTLHYDECWLVYKKHIDNVLIQYCRNNKVEIIICALLGESPMNPSAQCLKGLKDMGIYIVIVWPDTGPGWGTQTMRIYDAAINLHVSIDNPESPYHSSLPKKENQLFLWTPQDVRLYFDEGVKNIDVSFIGSPRYADRSYFLNYLLNYFPNLVMRGGQREDNLTPSKYAELIRRSKISLNFSLSPAGFYQTKERIFNIIASNTMLLELASPSTVKFFKPGYDYVEFYNPEDLLEKINYYLTNDNERVKISNQGYQTLKTHYTSNHVWSILFNRIKTDNKQTINP